MLATARTSDIIPGPELSEVLGQMLRESPERTGRKSPVQAAGTWINDVRRWRETFRTTWRFPEASNIVEARMILLAARHLGRARRTSHCRVLLFRDNLAALSVLARGRSSAPSLLTVCRGLTAVALGCGVRLQLRWVPSRRNHADGPSRGHCVGYLCGSTDIVNERVVRPYHG